MLTDSNLESIEKTGGLIIFPSIEKNFSLCFYYFSNKVLSLFPNDLDCYHSSSAFCLHFSKEMREQRQKICTYKIYNA